MDWSFKAKSSVLAWEAASYAFDAFNRFLWIDENANGTRGKDASGLELNRTYKTDRVGWWNIHQTDNLGKWNTSVVFIKTVRTKAGEVWTYDKGELEKQLRTLSLDTSEFK